MCDEATILWSVSRWREMNSIRMVDKVVPGFQVQKTHELFLRRDIFMYFFRECDLRGQLTER